MYARAVGHHMHEHGPDGTRMTHRDFEDTIAGLHSVLKVALKGKVDQP